MYVANDQSPAFLWHNQGDGTFRESAVFRGSAFNGTGEAIAGMGTAAEDFDGDGDLDLFVTNIRDRNHLFLRNDGGFFEDEGLRWGRRSWMHPYTGFGVVAFDQDLDGTLELFIANGAVARHPSPADPRQPYAEPNQFLRFDTDGRFVDASFELGETLASPPSPAGSPAVIMTTTGTSTCLSFATTRDRSCCETTRKHGITG